MQDNELMSLTADIVSTYVANNPLPLTGLPSLIAAVSGSIASLGTPHQAAAVELVPAVNPKKSITPDYIVCLEDGRKFKSMKRHLSNLGMTPEEYRAKWNLPAEYPMVAPNYAATRSALAISAGLGRKRTDPVPEAKAKAKERKKA